MPSSLVQASDVGVTGVVGHAGSSRQYKCHFYEDSRDGSASKLTCKHEDPCLDSHHPFPSHTCSSGAREMGGQMNPGLLTSQTVQLIS